MKKLALLFFLSLFCVNSGFADDEYYDEDYQYEEQEDEPKEGHSVLHKVVMWLPNRILDIIDIIKFDVGVGPAFGVTARATKYGNVALRAVPVSARVGLMGRRLPVAVEAGSETGVGPLIAETMGRDICAGEIGAGADLLIAGAYGGVCADELADFVAGLFFFDLKDDDL